MDIDFENNYNHAMFQMTEENLLEAECDILVPAANKKQITLKNAHKIKAKVLCY